MRKVWFLLCFDVSAFTRGSGACHRGPRHQRVKPAEIEQYTGYVMIMPRSSFSMWPESILFSPSFFRGTLLFAELNFVLNFQCTMRAFSVFWGQKRKKPVLRCHCKTVLFGLGVIRHINFAISLFHVINK